MQPPIQRPTPPPKPRVPFAQQAAMFSWVAPLVVIGISCAVNSMMHQPNRRQGPDDIRYLQTLALAVLYGVLILGGFACSITALIGMKKHGRKGILVPALIGLALNGFLITAILVGIILFTNVSPTTR